SLIRFVCFMARRPARSALFPYTTLFRSVAVGGEAAVERGRRRRAREVEPHAIEQRAVIADMPLEQVFVPALTRRFHARGDLRPRSEEHTSELQSREKLVCRLLPEKKKNT